MAQVADVRITRIGALTREGELFFTPCNINHGDIRMTSSGSALQVHNVLYPVEWYKAIDLHTKKSFADFKRSVKMQKKLAESPESS
jgi:hypothetical protein